MPEATEPMPTARGRELRFEGIIGPGGVPIFQNGQDTQEPTPSQVQPTSQSPDQAIGASEYAELSKLIRQTGLLKKQPVYYAGKILMTAGLLGVSVALMALLDNLWLQLVNAAFLAFVFGQIGFLGHDAGHQQIFRSSRNNDIVGLAITLILGVSRSWWVDKHNRHHSYPNQLSKDPDTFIPTLAFSEDQAISRSGFFGLVVKYQAYLYFPMLCLQGLGVRLASIQWLMHHRAKYARLEPILMGIALVPYLGVPIYLMGLWHGALFLLVAQSLYGIYLSSVFAPNHKGMPLVTDESQMDFMRRQVITARNVRSNPLTDFWYGGLNCQIEHHLFPTMPRNKLRDAQKIIREFCRTHAIPYYETSAVRSQGEILGHLHRVSAPLRRRKA